MGTFFTIVGGFGLVVLAIMLAIIASGFIRGFYLRKKMQKEIEKSMKGEEEHGSSSDGVH